METIMIADFVSIGELARITNMRYSTLKFYTEEGMLPFEQSEGRKTRQFPRKAAIDRLAFIQELKGIGFRIPEIKQQVLEKYPY